MIGYLNVNHFENKITNFREICHQAPIDIIYVNEANISFLIDQYQFPPFRRDRRKYGGGKIVYVRKGFIAKRPVNLEGNTS